MSVVVTKVVPSCGSLAGGTQLTVIGTGKSELEEGSGGSMVVKLVGKLSFYQVVQRLIITFVCRIQFQPV